MPLGDRTQRRRLQQRPRLAQRAVGHQRHRGTLLPGQQVIFDAACLEVVQHLIGAAARLIQLQQIVQVEVGNTPGADLALFAQALEACHGFRQRKTATPVQQIQVDTFAAQALEAALAGRLHTVQAGIVRVHLADQEHLVTTPGNGFSHHLLGTTLAIHLGAVDQRHAQVQPLTQRRDLARTLLPVFPHAPGTLPDHRYPGTSQFNLAHRQILE